MIEISVLVKSYEALILSFLFEHRLIFFAGFIGLFVGRRTYRALKGGKYTRKGLVLSPLMYLAFTSFTYIGLDLVGLLICSIAFAFGLGLSGLLKGQLHFFTKNNQLYYKRSIAIVAGWTVAYVFRLYLFIFYDVTVGLILSIILSYLTGLIIGEAFQIAIHKSLFDHNNYIASQLEKQEIGTDNQ